MREVMEIIDLGLKDLRENYLLPIESRDWRSQTCPKLGSATRLLFCIRARL